MEKPAVNLAEEPEMLTYTATTNPLRRLHSLLKFPARKQNTLEFDTFTSEIVCYGKMRVWRAAALSQTVDIST